MGDLTKSNSTSIMIEELKKIVDFGSEKHKAHHAKLKAIALMQDGELARMMRLKCLEETIDNLEVTWKTHAKMGELIGPEDKWINQYKVPGNTLPGIDHNDRRFARAFYSADTEGIIDSVVDKMRNDLNAVLENAKPDNRAALVKYYTPYLKWKRLHDNDPNPIVPIPAGKYIVIMADPPWPISKSDYDEKWFQAETIMNKYRRLPVDKICEMGEEVKKITAKDGCLFLWTTHTFLHQAFHVMKVWGFNYHVCITWDKGMGFTNFGFHRRTEFCLFGYSGKLDIPKGKAIPTLIEEKSRGHSIKPLILYELIEKRWTQAKLEMFARGPRDNWIGWGNEYESM